MTIRYTSTHSLPYPEGSDSVAPATRDFRDLAQAADAALTSATAGVIRVVRNLTETDHLNNLTAPGYYGIPSTAVATAIGAPEPITSTVLVIPLGAGLTAQTVTTGNLSGGRGARVWTRIKSTGWSGWTGHAGNVTGHRHQIMLEDGPVAPGHLVQLDHYANGSGAANGQTYGLDIHNYDGAAQAIVVHQYSDASEAFRLDNTDINAGIYINNTENLSYNPDGTGEGAPFLKFHPYNMGNFLDFAYLMDDLTFVNDTTKTWGFQAKTGPITRWKNAAGQVVATVEQDGTFTGGTSVTEINGKTPVNGALTLTAADVGAETPAGAQAKADAAEADAKAYAGTLAYGTDLQATNAVIDARTGTGKRPVGRDEIVVNVRDHGAVGDGIADDTAALESAWGTGGRTVLVPAGITLRITGRNTIPANTTIVFNNTTIVAGTDDFIFNLGHGTRWQGKVTIVTGSAAARGIYCDTGDVTIDDLTVTGPAPGTGAGNIRTNAVQVEDADGFSVDRLTVTNYDRPVRCVRSNRLRFGEVRITSYVCGMLFNGCQDVRVDGGVIETASPNAALTSGHNGVLMGADTEQSPATPAKNITLSRVVVRDAGEHAFRIGGPAVSQDIRFDDCHAINAAGCGFKVLADDPGTFHKGISFTNAVVEDCGIQDISRCGFLIQRAKDVTIAHPTVRKSLKSASVFTGIRITECDGVQVVNPTILDVAQDAVEVSTHVGTTEVGNTANVVVTGGLLKGYGRAALNIHSNGATLGPLVIAGTVIVGGGTAIFSNTSTSGTVVGVNTVDATILGACTMAGSFVNFTARIVGAFPADPGVNANFANGSFFQDTTTRLHRVRFGPWRRINNVGTSAQRPADAGDGEMFYATNLDKPLWFDGSAWRDAAGTVV